MNLNPEEAIAKIAIQAMQSIENLAKIRFSNNPESPDSGGFGGYPPNQESLNLGNTGTEIRDFIKLDPMTPIQSMTPGNDQMKIEEPRPSRNREPKYDDTLTNGLTL